MDPIAHGWMVSRRNEVAVVWHAGGVARFRTLVLRVPGNRVTIFILSNFAGMDIDTAARIAMRIVDRLTR